MKILAIWITKGLFIFVVCIAEWNVCSNLGFNQFGTVKFYNDIIERNIDSFSTWINNKNFPVNSFIVVHSQKGNEFTAIGVFTQSLAWVFLVYSYDGYYKMWRCIQGQTNVIDL